MTAVVRHLHELVVEVQPTDAEWRTLLDTLAATGRVTTAQRQEFVLWADVLGLSSLMEDVRRAGDPSGTESTVRGPFWVPGSPWRAFGDSIAEQAAGEPVWYYGRVVDDDGSPIGDAIVDVWQNGADSLYGVQDDSAPPGHLRGRFRTVACGRYGFVGVRPTPYKIPDDGPVGEFLRAVKRSPWRPGHVHLMVSADGYRTVTTHIFDKASAYLDSDAVFAVKPTLIRQIRVPSDGDSAIDAPAAGAGLPRTEFDVVLTSAGA